MQCLLCGGTEMKNYHTIPDLAECVRCGLVRTLNALQNIKEYYAKHEEYEADLEFATKKEHRIHEVARRISFVRSISSPKGKSLLEIGSHEGLFLEAAQRAGFSVMGIEPNEKAAEHAKAQGLDMFTGTLEDFTVQRTFDVIALFHVLEHFENPAEALTKINALLNPNGFLIIEVPNIESFPAQKKEAKWEYITSEHLSYFSPKTIRAILAKTGFRTHTIIYKDFDEWHVGIKTNLDRLGLMHIKTDGSTSTKIDVSPNKEKPNLFSPIRTFVRGLFVLMVKLLHRQNFLLAVAQKRKET